eukprot:TRINITY_DN7359_c0_g1_i10.p1 TRINITY_DN7359_c0_g1~~TRINITY_DN7359_c0_g1_i10.p1  ORF type:complete len:487 (-),score=41.04 TRINITY_DN7359_c0_g1_i10:456-1709(-)
MFQRAKAQHECMEQEFSSVTSWSSSSQLFLPSISSHFKEVVLPEDQKTMCELDLLEENSGSLLEEDKESSENSKEEVHVLDLGKFKLELLSEVLESNKKVIQKKLIRNLDADSEFVVDCDDRESFQYDLLKALFYYKNGANKVKFVKKMLNSFKHVEDTPMYAAYFPIRLFKQTLHSLNLVQLKQIQPCIENAKLLIQNLYRSAVRDNKRKISAVEIKLPFTPSNIRHMNMSGGCGMSHNIVLGDFYPFAVYSSNPNIMMYSALYSFIKLLNEHKSKKKMMFEFMGKLPQFELVNVYLQTLQVPPLQRVGYFLALQGTGAQPEECRGDSGLLSQPVQLRRALRFVPVAAEQVPNVVPRVDRVRRRHCNSHRLFHLHSATDKALNTEMPHEIPETSEGGGVCQDGVGDGEEQVCVFGV